MHYGHFRGPGENRVLRYPRRSGERVAEDLAEGLIAEAASIMKPLYWRIHTRTPEAHRSHSPRRQSATDWRWREASPVAYAVAYTGPQRATTAVFSVAKVWSERETSKAASFQTAGGPTKLLGAPFGGQVVPTPHWWGSTVGD